MKHFEKTIVVGVLITGWLLLLAFAYAMFWPTKTLVINSEQPIKVLSPVVVPGERLSYELDYCKYLDRQATVHRTLVDGQIITLQDTTGGLPVGCRKTIISTTIIPTTINPGEYYLDVNLDYQVNFFRTERVHYRTEYFKVGELPASQQDKQVIERQGQTVIVPAGVSVHEDENLAPLAPVIIQQNTSNSTTTTTEVKSSTGNSNSSQTPTPQPRPSVIDSVRNILGL